MLLSSLNPKHELYGDHRDYMAITPMSARLGHIQLVTSSVLLSIKSSASEHAGPLIRLRIRSAQTRALQTDRPNIQLFRFILCSLEKGMLCTLKTVCI